MIDPTEYEEAFIGSALINPSIIELVDLTPDQFYIQLLGKSWSIMQSLIKEKKNIDYLILSKEVGTEASYFINLANQTPTSVNYETYADKIKECSLRRKMLEQATKLANYSNSDSPPEQGIGAVISSLATIQRPKSGAKPIAGFASKLYDEISDLKNNPRDFFGIKTGLQDFDKITQGLQRGETFILSGEPGIGKSILSIQLALGMQKEQAGVIYELEMTANAILRRVISSQSKISVSKLRTGRFEDDQWNSLLEAIQKIEKANIFISDETHWTTSSLRADLSRLKNQHNVGWVIIDYLNLLSDTFGKDNNDRTTYISKQLHNIAKDLDLAILAIHSMNKAGMGGSTAKENLSGSGSISYDADAICFMIQDQTNLNLVEMKWDKVREGDSNRCMKIMRVKGFPAFVGMADARNIVESNQWWQN